MNGQPNTPIRNALHAALTPGFMRSRLPATFRTRISLNMTQSSILETLGNASTGHATTRHGLFNAAHARFVSVQPGENSHPKMIVPSLS